MPPTIRVMRLTALFLCIGIIVGLLLITLPHSQAATNTHFPQKIDRQKQKHISLTGTLTQINNGSIIVTPSRGKSISIQIDPQTTIQTKNNKPLSETNLGVGDHLTITFISHEQLGHFFVQAQRIVDQNKQ